MFRDLDRESGSSRREMRGMPSRTRKRSPISKMDKNPKPNKVQKKEDSSILLV